MKNRVSVNVIGLGYVGVTTYLHLTGEEIEVRCWDIDPARVEDLRTGRLPFGDHDLLDRFSRLPRNEAQFVQSAQELEPADLWVICVGTPLSPKTGILDVSHVKEALRTVLQQCNRLEQKKPIVLLRSTVPPLTYKNELAPILRDFSSLDPVFHYFPEFMREGSALSDYKEPALAVLGTEVPPNLPLIEAAFGLSPSQIDVVPIETSEMLKVSSNAFHALKVTFANEIASLCRSLGIDGEEVMRIFVKDKKLNISSAYLRPGSAYGGPCLGKDVKGLNQCARDQKLDLSLLAAITPSNDSHLRRSLELITKITCDQTSIGFVGTSFKIGCVDRRASPVIALLESYLERFPETLPYPNRAQRTDHRTQGN